MPEPGEPVPKFFDPQYWEGHMLGDGQMSPDNLGVAESREVRVSRSIIRSARQLIRQSLGEALSGEPIRSISPGQEFDIATTHEATFVLFDKEYLARRKVSDEKVPAYLQRDVGEDPDTTSLDWHSNLFVARDYADLTYIRSLRIGVVMRDEKAEGSKRLLAGWLNTWTLRPDGKAYSPSGLGPYKPVIPVGQVRHYQTLGRHEFIERVNKVELFRAERAQKERSPFEIRSLLGRRVAGWAQG